MVEELTKVHERVGSNLRGRVDVVAITLFTHTRTRGARAHEISDKLTAYMMVSFGLRQLIYHHHHDDHDHNESDDE